MELTLAILSSLIGRLFPPEERAAAAALLAGYGGQPGAPEPLRVRVALLKLSEGNVERLRALVADAHRDYRDVLAWAEYPTEMASPTWRLSAAEQARIRAVDREQYLSWLTAHAESR